MSVVAVGADGWRLNIALGRGWNWWPRIFIAVDPNCEPVTHPTRWCRCRAFKTEEQAREYVRQHDDSVA